MVFFFCSSGTFSFGDHIPPDTDLDVYLGFELLLLICYVFHPFSSISAKIGFAAVISPVSLSDKVRWDDFVFRSDLDLTGDLINLNLPEKHSLRSFDCRLARLAKPLTRGIGRWGRFCPSPQLSASGGIPQRGGVNPRPWGRGGGVMHPHDFF